MSIQGKINEDEQPLENFRRKLDLEGEKLNQISSNNREVLIQICHFFQRKFFFLFS